MTTPQDITPLPWRQAGIHGHNACYIFSGKDEDAVCHVYEIPLHTKIEDVSEKYREGMANAAYIVEACNNYPAMKTALLRAREVVNAVCLSTHSVSFEADLRAIDAALGLGER